MPKTYPIQINFAAGELSENLLARMDLEAYLAGAQLLENFITLPQGPFEKRKGFVQKGYHYGANNSSVAIGFPVDIATAFIVFFPKDYTDIFVYKLHTGTVVDAGINHPFISSTVGEIQIAYVPGENEIYIAHRNEPPASLKYDKTTDAWTISDITFTSKPSSWTGTNYPGTVCFHQGRSFWGGTPSNPEQFWASKSGSYKDLTTGSLADDGFTYTLANRGAICWMLSHKKLLIGTENSEYTIDSDGGILIPGDVGANRQSGYGSAYRQAILAGDKILYVDSQRTKIRDLNYKWTEDSWTSRDITFVSDHIFKNDKIDRFVFAPTENLLLVKTDTRKLMMATYERGNDIIGWHRHPITGALNSIASVDYQGRSKIVGSFDRTDRDVGGSSVSEVEEMTDGIYFDSCQFIKQDNLVDNPSFETNLNNWSAVNSATLTRTVRANTPDGFRAMRINRNGVDNYGAKSDAITVGNGNSFDFSCYVQLYKNDRATVKLYDSTMSTVFAQTTVTGNDPITWKWYQATLSGTVSVGTDVIIEVIHTQVLLYTYIYVDYFVLTGPEGVVTAAHLAGQTVGCKIDGVIYDDVTLDGSGNVTLPASGSDIQLGFNYTSKFKSLPLQYVAQGGSNVVFKKGLGRVYTRLISSAYPKIQGKRPPITPVETTDSKLISSLDLGYDEDTVVEIEQDLPLQTKIAGFFVEQDENIL